MLKTWKFVAIPLLMSLAYVATHAQSQSSIISGQYEREFVPPPTRSLSAESRGRFVSIGDKKAVANNALTMALMSGLTQLPAAPGSTASWPTWGHDSSPSGRLDVVGQSRNRGVAD